MIITYLWPEGHTPAQLRLIMRFVPPRSSLPPAGLDSFLAYVQRFDIIPQQSTTSASSARRAQPDPATGMYLLKRSLRADGTVVGDVIPLSQCRVPAEVTPRFPERADRRLRECNSMEFSSEFWLDKYFDKEFFYSLHLT
jgi:hypothetical protein